MPLIEHHWNQFDAAVKRIMSTADVLDMTDYLLVSDSVYGTTYVPTRTAAANRCVCNRRGRHPAAVRPTALEDPSCKAQPRAFGLTIL